MSPGLACCGSTDGVRTTCLGLITADESFFAGLAASIGEAVARPDVNAISAARNVNVSLRRDGLPMIEGRPFFENDCERVGSKALPVYSDVDRLSLVGSLSLAGRAASPDVIVSSASGSVHRPGTLHVLSSQIM